MSGSADAAFAPDDALRAAGFDLAGVLSRGDYDDLVTPAFRAEGLLPAARSAVVLATPGRAFFRALEEAPERADPDPVDAFTRRVVERHASDQARAGHAARAVFAFERRGGVFADFVALGERAGLGTPSRLGLLVHPEYGPWLAIRAVVLCERRFEPTPPLADFRPCDGCPAPCADACHGSALAGPRFDVAACGETRRRDPACARRCDARRACVLGGDHTYAPDAEAHHMRAALLEFPR